MSSRTWHNPLQRPRFYRCYVVPNNCDLRDIKRMHKRNPHSCEFMQAYNVSHPFLIFCTGWLSISPALATSNANEPLHTPRLPVHRPRRIPLLRGREMTAMAFLEAMLGPEPWQTIRTRQSAVVSSGPDLKRTRNR